MPGPLIVVGAGSSGAVVAARVSEDPSQHVLLLEAGPDYPPDVETPPDLRDGTRNSIERHDWGFRFRGNKSQGVSPFPRGKVVGGSSAVNTCIALRGQPYDYDEWAAHGGAHWAFSECLRYFKRLEHDLDFDNDYHGQDGPLPIRRHRPNELEPIQTAFLEGCERLGYPSCADHNDPTTTGAGPHAMNKIDGVRISTAMAYLTAAVRARENLRIEPLSQVRRVVLRQKRVVGVELVREGRLEVRPCSKLVLCAGAIQTPGILLRSGIGPRAVLDKMGVDLVVDAPVGERLLDHPGAAVVLVPRPGVGNPRAPIIQTTARFTPRASGLVNEMQLQPLSFLHLPMVPLLFGIAVVVGKTRGTGRLWFERAEVDAPPIIEPAMGEDPLDRARLCEGLERALEIAATPAVAALCTPAWPARELLSRASQDWLLPATGSGYHPCGSAPMGPPEDRFAVTDFHGRVRGVEGLVVADASLMPTVPSSNINLPTIMLGERFGEWLRCGAV